MGGYYGKMRGDRAEEGGVHTGKFLLIWNLAKRKSYRPEAKNISPR